MKKVTGKVMLVLAAAMMLLLTGCGGKKCFFVSQDGKELQKGASVVWYDAYVGRVDELEEVEAGTKVSFSLRRKFAKEIHDGVVGRVVNDPKISPKAFVLLVRGRDPKRPLIDNGAQIPESKPGNAIKEGFSEFVEWLKTSRKEELGVMCGILGLLCLFLKIAKKMYRLAIIVGILCAIGYVYVTVQSDWDNFKERFASIKGSAQEAKEWLQQHGEKLGIILETSLDVDD